MCGTLAALRSLAVAAVQREPKKTKKNKTKQKKPDLFDLKIHTKMCIAKLAISKAIKEVFATLAFPFFSNSTNL